MKNYTAGNHTYIGRIEKDTPFVKKGEIVGSFEKGYLRVKGYIKTVDKKYGGFNYSLFLAYPDQREVLYNVPKWYGEVLEKDFKESGEDAETFFNGASIKSIEKETTKYDTETIVITIY